ncbi:MAG: hypothetical protein IPO22_15485 [Anaerolineales bacterium]|nr:hypothetical protein [Anaerolineales bacterium]
MIIKAAGRFLTALFIAIVLGMGLYLAMHFIVQPIADHLDPVTPREENQSAQIENDVPDQPEKDIQSFDAGQFIRRLFSVAKNGVVFVFMTVIVVGFRNFIKKRPLPFFTK